MESNVKDLVHPTTTASAGPAWTIVTPRSVSASRTPSSATINAVEPTGSISAATSAELSRSASVVVIEQLARRWCSSARVGAELFVAKSTRTPTARSESTAWPTSPMGSPANQITPSRSMTHVP
jgi:hypothetical protein